jgi:biopolymer transport protein ExbB/TolQ
MNDYSSMANINKVIEQYRIGLENKLSKIPALRNNNEYELLKFGIIIFVCVFFGVIILANTIKTIQIYYRSKRNEKELESKYSAPEENVYQNEFINDFKFESELRRNVKKAGERQNKALLNVKREKVANREKDFTNDDVEKENIEASISLESIDKQNDEYEYKKEDTREKSYWNMLFVNADYQNV